MITLQADPLIEWNEFIPVLHAQTTEAQQWISDNILNQTPVDVYETINRVGKPDLTRITKQTYTNGVITLEVARIYKNNDDCSVASTTYTIV